MPNIDLHLHIDLITPSREIIPVYSAQSHSFVVQFIHILRVAWNNTGASIRDNTNILRTVQTPGLSTITFLKLQSAAASTFVGLVVGTGTAAPTINDYQLDTIINHGNGAGQLYYQVSDVSAVAIAAPSASVTLTRQFDNNSGADITIREVGMHAIAGDTGGNTRAFLVARDLPAAPITAPNGGGARLTYTVTITV